MVGGSYVWKRYNAVRTGQWIGPVGKELCVSGFLCLHYEVYNCNISSRQCIAKSTQGVRAYTFSNSLVVASWNGD